MKHTKAQTKILRVGDIVEMTGHDQRTRQLARQDGKREWVIIKIDPSVQCFSGDEGILIESTTDKTHTRWMERDTIRLVRYADNDRRDR